MYQGESEPVGACGWVGSGLDERLMREQGGGCMVIGKTWATLVNRKGRGWPNAESLDPKLGKEASEFFGGTYHTCADTLSWKLAIV